MSRFVDEGLDIFVLDSEDPAPEPEDPGPKPEKLDRTVLFVDREDEE